MSAQAKDDGQSAADARRAGLLAYQIDRQAAPAQATKRQRRLKRRVFETFDALLRFRGGRGLANGTVLVDLGAADGALVQVAADAGLDAHGFDASDGIDFEVDRLPLEDRSVDVLTCVSVIEHLSDPTAMLAEACRVLRPGGAMILVTPNWRYSARDFYDDPTHVHPYTPTSMHRVLRIHGFEGVYVGPWVVKKPTWIWSLSWRFAYARWCLPFRGDAPAWIPPFLKGQSRSIVAIGFASDATHGSKAD